VRVNEVGGDPDRLGLSAAAFHEANAQRARRHPAGMLTTATHDTKRGEDVRLRIAALSEMAPRWRDAVRRWHAANAGLVARTAVGPAPDPQTEYLVYQTLVGVWPLQPGGAPRPELVTRVQEYVVKATREAGLRTTWRDPEEAFEAGVADFVAGVLAPGSVIAAELAGIAGEAAEIAIVSGLAQTLLRCTSPGMPDTYQGTELWDDSLVDPDNRRPVDFTLRRRLLAELDAGADAQSLWSARRDGRVKLWVLSRALRSRRNHAGAMGAGGAYVPLAVTGRWADHLVAYARVGPEGDALVVVVPRLPGRVMDGSGEPPVGAAWADTAVALPSQLAGMSWSNTLTGQPHPAGRSLDAAAVLATLPVALLAAG
jgi:(1->4)-alpha-D-glucan 1-alpha-D-glucosylmutase